MNEIRVELLIGKKVFDSNGELLGRLEEIHSRPEGKDLVFEEYLVGTYGLLERLSVIPLRIPLLPFISSKKVQPLYKIPWDRLDLSDPENLRAKCSKRDLENSLQ